jgi:hypothetical protein
MPVRQAEEAVGRQHDAVTLGEQSGLAVEGRADAQVEDDDALVIGRREEVAAILAASRDVS